MNCISLSHSYLKQHIPTNAAPHRAVFGLKGHSLLLTGDLSSIVKGFDAI